MGKKSLTLLELLTVIVIVGILATLGLVNYGSLKEKSLDKEAIVNLKLLRAAERSYYVESTGYYPNSGSESGIANINSNLKLDLPAATNRNWNYAVYSTGCGQTTRNGNNLRNWCLTRCDADGEPEGGTPTTGTCGSASCPVCP